MKKKKVRTRLRSTIKSIYTMRSSPPSKNGGKMSKIFRRKFQPYTNKKIFRGLRLADDFLSKNPRIGRCSDFRQVMELISKNGLKTYLGFLC